MHSQREPLFILSSRFTTAALCLCSLGKSGSIPSMHNRHLTFDVACICSTFKTLTLPGPSAGVSGSLDNYCSLTPLCSGMGEVVPARTSPTLLSPSPRTVLSLSCFKVLQCINCRDWHCKSQHCIRRHGICDLHVHIGHSKCFLSNPVHYYKRYRGNWVTWIRAFDIGNDFSADQISC